MSGGDKTISTQPNADGKVKFPCEEAWTVTADKIEVLQRRTQWVQKYIANTFRVKQIRDAIVVRAFV